MLREIPKTTTHVLTASDLGSVFVRFRRFMQWRKRHRRGDQGPYVFLSGYRLLDVLSLYDPRNHH